MPLALDKRPERVVTDYLVAQLDDAGRRGGALRCLRGGTTREYEPVAPSGL